MDNYVILGWIEEDPSGGYAVIMRNYHKRLNKVLTWDKTGQLTCLYISNKGILSSFDHAQQILDKQGVK